MIAMSLRRIKSGAAIAIFGSAPGYGSHRPQPGCRSGGRAPVAKGWDELPFKEGELAQVLQVQRTLGALHLRAAGPILASPRRPRNNHKRQAAFILRRCSRVSEARACR